jgi:hypothetical protein
LSVRVRPTAPSSHRPAAREIVVIREWWYIGSDNAEVTMIRLWRAHERVSVKRATAEEGKR